EPPVVAPASAPDAGGNAASAQEQYRWPWRRPFALGLRGAGALLLDLALLTVLGVFAVVYYRSLLFSDQIASDPRLMRLVYPQWQYLAGALRAGRIPFWNPHLFTGVPFLADPQTAVLYPGSSLLRWWDAPDAFAASTVAHAMLAAAGMFFCARWAFGMGRGGAL